MIGRVLGNRYEIQERLGGGGMAVVYRAHDTYLHRSVSVKILRSQFASDADFVRRFRREAMAVASLSHPNVVAVYDVGEEPDDTHYIVMEYVKGQTLQELLRERAPLPAEEAARLTAQILEALGHAHENGVIHRDVKPHNILITDGGRVKVTDFGIARAASQATLVHTGSILGSAHYLSPEQARGGPLDERSDLYAVGIVLYEMLAGRRPFDGDTALAVAMQHIQAEVQAPRSHNPAIPRDLERVVLHALAKEPARRYQSAAEFRSDLEAWLAGRRPACGGAPGGRDGDAALEATREIAGGSNGGAAFVRQLRGAFNRAEAGVAAAHEARPLSPEDGEDEEEEPPEAADEPPRRRRRRLAPLLLVALTVLLGLTAGAVFAFWQWVNVPLVTVPDVTGRSQLEAQRLLSQAGLEWRVGAEQYTDDAPAGTVIGQDPRAGETARQGGLVELVISRGPEYIAGGVPSVLNQPRLVAINTLRNAGLEPVAREEFDDTVPAGYVSEQNPRPGSPVRKGDTVELTISEGPRPQPVVVPGLVGLTLDEARQALEKVNLRVGQIQAEKGGYREDRILAQDPPAAATAQEGDAVDLTVSEGCEHESQVSARVRHRDTQVRFLLRDAAGDRVIYNEREDRGLVSVPVCWTGDAAQVIVYFDGIMQGTNVLHP